MISTFCSREELDAAMNDEFLPPFAEAELVNPELLPDIPSASVTWMQEYENRLAHVREVLQARQAKAAKAAQPLGPKRGRGRPRKNPLPSPAELRAYEAAKKRKQWEHAVATLTKEQLAALRARKAKQRKSQRAKVDEQLSEAEIDARNLERAENKKMRRDKAKVEKVKALLAVCQRLLEDD